MMQTAIDTYAVSDQGNENVNSTSAAGAGPSDKQLRLQFTTLGADVSDLTHPTTPLGKITRAEYSLKLNGQVIHACFLAIRTDNNFVGITIAATTADRAAARGDQIEENLSRLP